MAEEKIPDVATNKLLEEALEQLDTLNNANQALLETIETLNRLKTMGITVSIDDFGTGYSSLSYLTRFPLDWLKIDRAFVNNLPDEDDAVAIVRAIVSMAKNLDLKLVAEGVETDNQVGFLHALGCHVGQGYLFSKPVPADDFQKLLTKNRPVFLAAERA